MRLWLLVLLLLRLPVFFLSNVPNSLAERRHAAFAFRYRLSAVLVSIHLSKTNNYVLYSVSGLHALVRYH